MANPDKDDSQPILPTRFAFIYPQASPKNRRHKIPKRHSSHNHRELIISPGAHRSLDRKRTPRPLHPSSNKREGVDHNNPPPVPSRAPAWTSEINMARNREPPTAPYTRAPVGVERGKEQRNEEGRGSRGKGREEDREAGETSRMGASATQLARFQREQEARKARGEEGHATRWARGNVVEDEPRGFGSGNAARGSERSKRSDTLTPARSNAEREVRERGSVNISTQRGAEGSRKSGNMQQAQSFGERGLQESESGNKTSSHQLKEYMKNGSIQRTKSFVPRAMSAVAGVVKSLKDLSRPAAASQVEKFENSRIEKSERANSGDEQSQRTIVEQDRIMRAGSTEGRRSQESAAVEQERSMRPETRRRSTTSNLNTARRAQSAMLKKVESEAADRALAASMQAEEVQAAESEEESRKTAERLALAEEVNSIRRSEAFGSLPYRTNSLPMVPIRASARSGPFSGIQRRQTVNAVPLEGGSGGLVSSAERQRSKIVSQAQSNRINPRTPTSPAERGEEQRSKAVPQNKSNVINGEEIALPAEAEYRSKRASEAPLKSSKSRSNSFSPEEGARMTSKDSPDSIQRVQSAPAQAPPTPSNVVTANGSQQRRSNSNTRNTIKANRQEELESVVEEYVSEGETSAKTVLGRGFGDGRRTEMQGVRLRSEVENVNAAVSSPRYSIAASKVKTELNRGFGDGRRSEMQGVRLKSEVERTNVVASNPRYGAAASRAKTELNRGFGDGRRSEIEGVRPKSEVERDREVSPSKSESSVKTVLNRGFGNGGRSVFEGVRAKSEVDNARDTRR